MDLSPYVEQLRHELAVAAAAGGEDARALAERLSGPLESAARLVLLGALSTAAGEITRDLAPGSVDLRLRGLDPEFVVTAPPSERLFDATDTASDRIWDTAATTAPGDDAVTARINFRLAELLKTRIEEAATREGLSVNAWLVRASTAALQPDDDTRSLGRRRPSGGQRYTGWVR